MREWLGVYLRGFAMGAADAVPGVSGGTIALITGIYERFVDALASVSERGPRLVDALVGEHNPGRVAAVRRELVAMDVAFLVALGGGVLTGVVSLANAVEFAQHSYPALTFAFFFGLILAAPIVLRREVAFEPRALAAGAVGFLLAFWISGLPESEAEVALPVLFVVGAVAICAMVLPGVSGSLILLILGQYTTMTGAVSGVTDALTGGSFAAALDPLAVLVVFTAGAAVGVLTFARVVSWAIDTARAVTMTFLVGVMVGALRLPALRIGEHVDAVTATVAGGLLAAGAFGALAVVALEVVTDDLDV